MLEGKREDTAQSTGPWPCGSLRSSHLHRLLRGLMLDPVSRAPRKQVTCMCGLWCMRWMPTAEAVTPSWQVSWNLPALPEPEAPRSWLPPSGIRHSPPQELGAAFSGSRKPLPTPPYPQLLPGHRDTRSRTDPGHGGLQEENHHPRPLSSK